MEIKTTVPIGLLIFSMIPLIISGCCSQDSDSPWNSWTNPLPDTKMINSAKAFPNEFPWMVGLKAYYPIFSPGSYDECGGALFNRQWVITAAHCLTDELHGNASKVELFFGWLYLSAKQKFSANDTVDETHYYVHPNYESIPERPPNFDLALIKLRQPINVNEAIRPIPLTTTCSSNYLATDETVDGCKYATAIGWGNKEKEKDSIILRKGDMKVEPLSRCMEDLEIPFHESIVCAIGRNEEDVCRGDSGGPLMCHSPHSPPTLLGIVSWGKVCRVPGHMPGIYARVCGAMTWIQEIVGKM